MWSGDADLRSPRAPDSVSASAVAEHRHFRLRFVLPLWNAAAHPPSAAVAIAEHPCCVLHHHCRRPLLRAPLPLPSRSDGGDRAGIKKGGGCGEKRRTVRRQADLPTNSAATWSVAAVTSFPSAASIVFPASTSMAGSGAVDCGICSIQAEAERSLSLSQGQRGNLCAAKATVGGGWTYGGGGGWLSGGSGGEGEGETRGMSSLFTACVVVITLGMERGRWGAASDSCRTLPSAWTKEELSLAVEHDMLLWEECSIVFTLIKRRPTLPRPKPLVAGPSPSPHGALALSSARELFLQLRDTVEDTTTPVPLKVWELRFKACRFQLHGNCSLVFPYLLFPESTIRGKHWTLANRITKFFERHF
uniref:Uncharacterized protein n=1 Tax=Oryza glumipatula TaxID=40148 RepID=A0A0D9Z7C3_9ORYZ